METTVSIPTAKAGEQLVAPALVKANFISASVRSLKDEAGVPTTEIIVLQLEGLPTNVIRTLDQVKGDLSSFYTKERLQDISKKAIMCVHAYNDAFGGKEVTFMGSYHEVGAVQTIDSNSKLYINGITNPETNKPFAIGDTTPTKAEGIWVEGFLNAMVSVEESRAILSDYFASLDKAKEAEDALAI